MRPDRLLPQAALLALGVLTLVLRPPLPDDETRYLAVAWDMHRTGAWLVPTLEGDAYAHKPPLLFWLIRAGWLVLGPVEWWPRMLPPLFGCGAMALGAVLARRLWRDEAVAGRACWVILGTAGFTVYSTVLLFDLMIACCTMLGLYGLALARDGVSGRGFVLYGLALALGGLAKGPVILLYLMPAALLAPLWAGPRCWRRWYLGCTGALLAALAVCLAWALPAAAAGGAAYADAILWRQTAGRIVDAFAHRRPAWWYLPVLPVLFLPWTIWPLWRIRPTRLDPGERLCLLATAGGFVAFSVVSGKQAHYLVPLLPPLALVLAHRVASPMLPRVALGMLCLLSIALIVGRFAVLPRYDLRPAAAIVARAEAEGRPVAFVGRYDGEITWLARLRRPVKALDASTMLRWAETRPGGILIVVHRRGAGESVGAPVLHRQQFRGRDLSLWPAAAAPELLERLP